MANAKAIQKYGLQRSASGLLGPGIYLGDKDKATQFAFDSHPEAPALLQCRVTVRKPKFVEGDDSAWERQGYDGCRAERTSMSSHPEWCVACSEQIVVVGVTDLLGGSVDTKAASGPVAIRSRGRAAGAAKKAGVGPVHPSEMDMAVAEAAVGLMAGRRRLPPRRRFCCEAPARPGSELLEEADAGPAAGPSRVKPAKTGVGYATDLSLMRTDFSEACSGPARGPSRVKREPAKAGVGYATDLSLIRTDFSEACSGPARGFPFSKTKTALASAPVAYPSDSSRRAPARSEPAIAYYAARPSGVTKDYRYRAFCDDDTSHGLFSLSDGYDS